jgi:opacity protein-like surface antigen
MKRIILIALLTIVTNCFCQTSKFSIEAAYPLPVDQNFLGDHFKGIADLGIKYRIKNLQVINIGLSANGSMFTHSDTGYLIEYDEIRSFKTTLYLFQPRVYGELNLKKIIKIHPFIGVGYSFLFANTDSQPAEVEQINTFYEETNKSGLNINVGLSYDIFTKVYLFASYDYITLTNLDEGVPSSTYNTKANLLKLGVGIRL